MGVVRRFVVAGLDEAARRSGRRGAMRIGALDESGQEKKGEATCGVKRQHMGCAGRVENGINTVHLSYVREKTGHALIGARHYRRLAEGPHRHAGPPTGQAGPAPAARSRDDPADRPRGQPPARRRHAQPARPRRTLVRLDPPPPGPLTLVPPARQTRQKHRDRPGQLAKGGCRTRRDAGPGVVADLSMGDIVPGHQRSRQRIFRRAP
jgi:DDE superfamily endonuclease